MLGFGVCVCYTFVGFILMFYNVHTVCWEMDLGEFVIIIRDDVLKGMFNYYKLLIK